MDLVKTEDNVRKKVFILNKKLNEELRAYKFYDIEVYFHIYSKWFTDKENTKDFLSKEYINTVASVTT